MIELIEKTAGNKVRCLACAHQCEINDGDSGICKVRKNKSGKLDLEVYGYPCSVAIDPIEKKPLYHFMPGSSILSIGTFSCNFSCRFCQNSSISQLRRSVSSVQKFSPSEIVKIALDNNIPAIAFTYNEPTVFFEFAYDIGVLSRKKGLKNVFVSNAFMSDLALEKSKDFLDAVNFDLKSFSEDFYRKICGGRLEIVLENIKKVHESDIHLEITTLLIDGYNDSPQEIKKIAEFIASLSPEVPWHISRSFPCFKMRDIVPTPLETMLRAKKIAKDVGLKNVYLGNM